MHHAPEFAAQGRFRQKVFQAESLQGQRLAKVRVQVKDDLQHIGFLLSGCYGGNGTERCGGLLGQEQEDRFGKDELIFLPVGRIPELKLYALVEQMEDEISGFVVHLQSAFPDLLKKCLLGRTQQIGREVDIDAQYLRTARAGVQNTFWLIWVQKNGYGKEGLYES